MGKSEFAHTHTQTLRSDRDLAFFLQARLKYLLAEIGSCVSERACALVCVCGVYLEIQIEIFEA